MACMSRIKCLSFVFTDWKSSKMSALKLQKRLAADVMKCGKNKVISAVVVVVKILVWDFRTFPAPSPRLNFCIEKFSISFTQLIEMNFQGVRSDHESLHYSGT